ncbi:Reverse transcriptase domain [Arabidopsis suecica]|uniref:Reverse transcriptase domain n=1 Tax=Arabidopsis suecica TaxID=45249 RepID=A0A8T1YQ99_ARASU|nr:Reverse transcriptase domain [Arabidopsis suecica]
MMMDVGEKDRPPGDPPAASMSWVKKVTRSSTGGLSIPKEILDDEFVSARVSLDFPDGEDGEPVITICSDVLAAMNGMWKNCMRVKVLGRNMLLAVLSKKLRELWRPSGAMFVMDLPLQFFMGSVMINGERYFVAYECLMNICSICGMYGHLVHNCPRGNHEKAAVALILCVPAVTTRVETGQSADGFTVVRKSGRRSEQQRKNVGSSAGVSRGNFGKNIRDLRIRKDLENISLSNSFGKLREDLADPPLREEVVMTEENKENEDLSNQLRSKAQLSHMLGAGFRQVISRGLCGSEWRYLVIAEIGSRRSPMVSQRSGLLEQLTKVVSSVTGPVVIGGDFNTIVRLDEQTRGNGSYGDTSPFFVIRSCTTLCAIFTGDARWITNAPELENLAIEYYKQLYSMEDVDEEVASLPHEGFMPWKPEKITQFRPKSLCNVLFKIITKTMVERLKRVMTKLIGPAQSSFIPGRVSMDNIVVVQEAVHSMKRKKGRKGWMLLKLNLEKAYDRIRWDFLEDTLIAA